MMKLFRLMTILRVISSYRLDTLIPLHYWPRGLRLLVTPFFLSRIQKPRAERLRLALETLGPVCIKFGQQLSTRPDLIPADIALELSKLQENAPPFPVEQVIQIIEKALNQPIDSLFKTFNKIPLAAASVAQVHQASLMQDEAVVVKVIRPDIEKIIQQDMTLLCQLAKLLNYCIPSIHRFRLLEVFEEYKKNILNELNLKREAASASQLRRNFKDSNELYVPKIYWPYCHQEVMVLEYVQGIPINDRDTLLKQGVNIEKVAQSAVLVFFKQVFRDNFFHADMHPGNIFVNADNPDKPYFIAIDFGLMGSLSMEDQSYLARNLLAFFDQNYKRVAELHIESGWVDSDTSVYEFESEIRTICEPTFGCALEDISLGSLLLGLFKAARRFNMTVQPQLILLEKTLLNIEGMGRQLYPKLNLWETAKPFLDQWIKRRVAPLSVVRRLSREMPDWIEKIPILSQQVIQKTRLKQVSVAKKNKRLTSLIGINCLMIGLLSLAQYNLQDLPSHFSWIVIGIGVILCLKPLYDR